MRTHLNNMLSASRAERYAVLRALFQNSASTTAPENSQESENIIQLIGFILDRLDDDWLLPTVRKDARGISLHYFVANPALGEVADPTSTINVLLSVIRENYPSATVDVVDGLLKVDFLTSCEKDSCSATEQGDHGSQLLYEVEDQALTLPEVNEAIDSIMIELVGHPL